MPDFWNSRHQTLEEWWDKQCGFLTELVRQDVLELRYPEFRNQWGSDSVTCSGI